MKIIPLLLLLFLATAGRAQFSWENVPDYPQLNYVTYDLEDQNVLYALTDVNHIVVSYDNGMTWDLLYSFTNARTPISDLKLLPGDENLCFTVRDQTDLSVRGIYLLNIETATLLDYIPYPSEAVGAGPSDIFDVYDADAINIIVGFSTDTGMEVYHTATGGENWTKIYDSVENSELVVSTGVFAHDNPAKILLGRANGPLGGYGGLLITEDYGQTWAQMLDNKWITALAVDPTDSNDILASTGYGGDTGQQLYRSTDGGLSWSELSMEWVMGIQNTVTGMAYHPTIEGTIFILEENQIFYTNNDGDTWENHPFDPELYNYGSHLTVNPYDGKQVVISTNDFPVQTFDGGATITSLTGPHYLVDDLAVLRYNGAEHLYYSAAGGHFHKNIQTGEQGGYNIDFLERSPYRNQVTPDPSAEGRVFIYDYNQFAWGGDLYISHDHGATRTLVLEHSAAELTTVKPDQTDPNHVYVVLTDFGSASYIFNLDLSDPSNITYEEVPTPGTIAEEDHGEIRGLTASTGEEETSFLITCNNKIYRSDNSGNEWQELFSITEGDFIRELEVNELSPENMAIATDAGVYTSIDGGTTWSASVEGIEARAIGLSDVEDGIMAISVQNEGESSGTYVMYFNGSDWVTVWPADFAHSDATKVDFTFSQGHINAYFATVDLGLFRHTFEIGELGTNDPVAVGATIELYPNPADSMFTVRLPAETGLQTVCIADMNGKLLKTSTANTVDVSDLAQGLYIITITTDTGKTYTAKVIKK